VVRSLLILLAVVLAAEVVSATVLCTARSGQIMARERCRKRERPLDVVGIGQPGSDGPMGPAGAPGRSPLRVVDAAGTEVALLRLFGPSNDNVLLTHPLLGGPRRVLVTRQGSLDGLVFHASSDCSGDAFIRRTGPAFVVRAEVLGDVVYWPADGSGQAATMGSVHTAFSSGGTSFLLPGGTWCRPEPEPDIWVPALSVPLSAIGIVPPLRAEAR